MFSGRACFLHPYVEESIWKHFVPESQKHTFARGGYYSTTTSHLSPPLPLTLVSLNTLYMYDNNKAVDGCPRYDERKGGKVDPGTEMLLWLEQQLILARTKGDMVILTGHVPPTVANWYPRCFKGYSDLVLRFHDTIVGQHFGHMNIDHFTFLQPPSRSHGRLDSLSPVKSFASSSSIASSLLAYYRSLPLGKKEKDKVSANESDFAVVHVGPSVIPTYLPSLRVWRYNTSVDSRWRQPMDEDDRDAATAVVIGARNETIEWRYGGTVDQTVKGEEFDRAGAVDEAEEDDGDDGQVDGRSLGPVQTLAQRILPPSLSDSPLVSFLASHYKTAQSLLHIDSHRDRKHKKKKKRGKRRPRVPRPPQHYSPLAPSVTNRFLTHLGYTQLSLALAEANENDGYGPGATGEAALRDGGAGPRPDPPWRVEYTTFDSRKLAEWLVSRDGRGEREWYGSKLGLDHDDEDEDVDEDDVDRVVAVLESGGLTPYVMGSGVVGEWMDLAKRLSEGGREWRGFRGRVFVGSGAEYDD